jgi:hypothetical protein
MAMSREDIEREQFLPLFNEARRLEYELYGRYSTPEHGQHDIEWWNNAQNVEGYLGNLRRQKARQAVINWQWGRFLGEQLTSGALDLGDLAIILSQLSPDSLIGTSSAVEEPLAAEVSAMAAPSAASRIIKKLMSSISYLYNNGSKLPDAHHRVSQYLHRLMGNQEALNVVNRRVEVEVESSALDEMRIRLQEVEQQLSETEGIYKERVRNERQIQYAPGTISFENYVLRQGSLNSREDSLMRNIETGIQARNINRNS